MIIIHLINKTMTILRSVSEDIHKLLEAIGIDYQDAYSVDIHIEAGEDVLVTIVKFIEDVDLERLKEVKKYKLIEIE